MERPTRRQVLGTTCALSWPAIAGCLGDGGDAPDGSEVDRAPADGTGTNENDVDGDEEENGTTDEDEPNDEDGPDDPDDEDADPIRWRYDDGATVAEVSGGRVYGLERTRDAAGFHATVALDAESGDRLWGYGQTGPYSGFTPPVVGDDAVYVGWYDDAIGSASGEVYAIGHDGSERWTAEVGSVYGRPVLHDGVLYAGTDDEMLYAFDAGDGTELWSTGFGGEDESPTALPETVAVVDGELYVVEEETIHGIDPDGGDERWRYDAGARIQSHLVGDGLYYTTRDRIGHVVGGDERWATDDDGSKWLQGALGDALVVEFGYDVGAVDATDGERLWTAGFDQTASVLIDDRVYVGTDEVRALTDGGETAWSEALDGTDVGLIGADDDGIYATTEEAIYALDRTGEVTGSVQATDPGGGVVADRVYVGSEEGILAVEL